MADNAGQLMNEARGATRSMYEAFQGMASTQFNILQHLGDIKRDQFSQAVEAANEQMQLVGKVRDPCEFATAQADLVKHHGQKYIESVKESVNVVADAWQEYGDRLAKGANGATHKARHIASSK